MGFIVALDCMVVVAYIWFFVVTVNIVIDHNLDPDYNDHHIFHAYYEHPSLTMTTSP